LRQWPEMSFCAIALLEQTSPTTPSKQCHGLPMLHCGMILRLVELERRGYA
jgi:hypothetical protein